MLVKDGKPEELVVFRNEDVVVGLVEEVVKFRDKDVVDSPAEEVVEFRYEDVVGGLPEDKAKDEVALTITELVELFSELLVKMAGSGVKTTLSRYKSYCVSDEGRDTTVSKNTRTTVSCEVKLKGVIDSHVPAVWVLQKPEELDTDSPPR